MDKLVVPLAIVGMADAISYMIVAPSIIFYVLENGGTKDQYGIILSAFSFASFCTKPVLGSWADSHGFRSPYFVSLGIAILGSFLYVVASIIPHTDGSYLAVYMILLSRLLNGVGAASSTLGYAYVAQQLPGSEQTKMNSLLSMIRIFGMAAGPGVNVFLHHVDFWIGSFHLNSLNSVGVVLMLVNALAFGAIYFFLEEPRKGTLQNDDVGKHNDDGSWLKNLWSLDILVYLLSIFTFNASFQIIETAFAPAAKDALGWGPIETSTVLGSASIVIFLSMLLVFQLSARKVSDTALLAYGLIQGGVGYTLMYYFWTQDGSMWHFTLPIVVGASSFPFLGAPTRSLFTQIVDSKPELDAHHGIMQAVLSMGASVAGFMAPSFIASFVLKDSDQVNASVDKRELTMFAFFSPGLIILTLVGHLYVQHKRKQKQVDDFTTDMNKDSNKDSNNPKENSPLIKSASVRNKTAVHKRRYDPAFAIHRQDRKSVV